MTSWFSRCDSCDLWTAEDLVSLSALSRGPRGEEEYVSRSRITAALVLAVGTRGILMMEGFVVPVIVTWVYSNERVQVTGSDLRFDAVLDNGSWKTVIGPVQFR